MKSHEGAITLKTEPQRGSRFEVFIPAAEASDRLDAPAAEPQVDAYESSSPAVPKQMRAHKAALRALRERVQRSLASPRTAETISPSPPPRYDDVYAEGQEWLDALAGERIEPGETTMTVHDDVWKSRGRREPGIS